MADSFQNMPVLILAGGRGTRIGEETQLRPKPMVEIGGYPILWHIMKIYSHYGCKEFIILSGYLSHMIKDFFVSYYQRYSDMTIDMRSNTVSLHRMRTEEWKVTVLYTGSNDMTGSRVKQAEEYVGGRRFFLTYGDGVSDVPLDQLLASHAASKKLMTVTAVQPAGRFGALDLNADNEITAFHEKPQGDGGWINGGFFVCEPDVFSYIPARVPDCVLERGPMERMAANGLLYAYRHTGFWHSMDTLKDKNDLTELWATGRAPWRIWQHERF